MDAAVKAMDSLSLYYFKIVEIPQSFPPAALRERFLCFKTQFKGFLDGTQKNEEQNPYQKMSNLPQEKALARNEQRALSYLDILNKSFKKK